MRVTADVPVFSIGASRGWRLLDLRELWAYRELVLFLTWRDIAVRYKQTAIGVAWAILQPLSMMGVFTLFFGKLAAMPSDGTAYPLFAYAGLLPWQLFSRSLSDAANSLVKDQQLISRVYFPRILVPVSTTLAAVVDFVIAGGVLAVLMAVYGVRFGPSAAWLPVFFALLLLASLGAGFWLSALNVKYRDVTYALPFLSQFWMFLTPVVYPSSLVPERWRWALGLNPMSGVVEGFRWALLGSGTGPSPMLAVSSAVAVALFVSGLIWFRRQERQFADVIGSGGR
jgi:lipopolysaccharide transport system permease protein